MLYSMSLLVIYLYIVVCVYSSQAPDLSLPSNAVLISNIPLVETFLMLNVMIDVVLFSIKTVLYVYNKV